MGFFDKLFGRGNEPEQPQQPQYGQSPYGQQPGGGYGYGQPGQHTRPMQSQQPEQPGQLTDEQAIARYRYMLQTAPPETIEQAHEEAFTKLTPEQRRMVLEQLRATLPERERAAGAGNQDDPKSLARLATRAEMRQPGTLERTFGNMPAAPGISMGGLLAGSFLSSFAGVMLGGFIANQFFGGGGYNEGYQAGENADNTGTDSGQQDTGDTGTDSGQDTGSDMSDAGAGDYSGGDYAGSDFGGGDFGSEF